MQNNGTRPVTFVKVIITAYDEGGKVVGTDFTYAASSNPMAPGAKLPFKMTPDNHQAVKRYALSVEGRPV